MRPEQGWYLDPSNSSQLRWWDGRAWTAQTRSAEGAVPTPPSADEEPAAASPAQEQPSAPDLVKRQDAADGQAQAQPSQSEYGQSEFEQPEFEQPGYGQSQYGQPQYGQPEYEQPQYGQPEYEQPQYGAAPSGQGGITSSGQPGYHSAAGGQQPGYGQSYSTIGGGSPYPSSAVMPLGGQYPLANQWMRLLARLLDGLITGIPVFILTLPWIGGYLNAFQNVTRYNPSTDPLAIYREPGYYNYLIAGALIGLIIQLLYEGLMLSKKGATIGKMVCNLRVEDQSGANLSVGRAMSRVLSMVLPNYVTCFLWSWIDSLWCLWDANRECLHDKMVKSRVVSTERR